MSAREITLSRGLYSLASHHSVVATVDRLESGVRDRGMSVIARIDHSNNADSIGMRLPPTQVLVFGNPKLGTRLMKATISAAIDLPMRILVTEGDDGTVTMSWIDPEHLKRFHHIEGCDELLTTMQQALSTIATEAAAA